MEFSQVIAARRTIRDFAQQRVPEEIILKALSAGLKAPSYNHLKEWYFILTEDQAVRRKITQTETMYSAITEGMQAAYSDYETLAKTMYFDAIPKQKRMILSAPGLLTVVYKPKTPVEQASRVYDLNGFASVWCCVENILLSFAEDSVFGVTFIPQNTAAVKQALGIPDAYEVACIIPFGYRSDSAKIIPQKDVALKDVVHHDTW